MDLKTSIPAQWYSKLKRMASYDQIKTEEVNAESICSFTDKKQTELIACPTHSKIGTLPSV